MCFEVVLCHFYDGAFAPIWLIPFKELMPYAVPCFMILAFYFSSHIFLTNDWNRLKKRLFRLLFPLIIWSLIYYVALSVIGGVFLPLKALLLQMLFGHSLNTPMWFTVNLLWLTLLFQLILKKKNGISFLLTISAICLLIQYFGVYLPIMDLGYNLSYPIGRLFEMIPYATCGVILFKYNLLNQLRSQKVYVFFYVF